MAVRLLTIQGSLYLAFGKSLIVNTLWAKRRKPPPMVEVFWKSNGNPTVSKSYERRDMIDCGIAFACARAATPACC